MVDRAPGPAGSERVKRRVGFLTTMPEVIECLHVTGQDSWLLQVVAKDMMHLEAFIQSINMKGETRTSTVLSHPIPVRGIQLSPSAVC